jgi:hypothetical protein
MNCRVAEFTVTLYTALQQRLILDSDVTHDMPNDVITMDANHHSA